LGTFPKGTPFYTFLYAAIEKSVPAENGPIFNLTNKEVQRWFPSIRSPWWRVGGSWLGWRGTSAV